MFLCFYFASKICMNYVRIMIFVWMVVVLKSKLKGLRCDIKVWSRREYGEVDTKLALLKEDISDLDERSERGLLTNDEVERRKIKFEEWWCLLKSKQSMLFQRSRSKWLKEGDANSKYFHRCIKTRVSRNAIKALKVEGEWIQSPSEIKRAVVDYFQRHVLNGEWERPRLDGVNFAFISEERNGVLIAPFSLLEIEKVVKESDGNNSPGQDGFNCAFFKKFWYLIKNEVRIFFDQFHGNEVFPRVYCLTL
jgi:hypothetical protein